MGGENGKYAYVAYVNICGSTGSGRFRYDELIKYKSKYLIYKNIKLDHDINFFGKCIPAIFNYKYIIHIPSIKRYLFIDENDTSLFIISPEPECNRSSLEICGPTLSTNIFDEALVYLNKTS